MPNSHSEPFDSLFDTLPDYLEDGLRLVFVGINPGLSSVRAGHYFSSRTNRFWRATNAAGIFDPSVEANTDRMALDQGIGFTDLVKRPTANASELRADDFRNGSMALRERLERNRPLIVCFNGITACRNYLKYGEKLDRPVLTGFQTERWFGAEIFVAPSQSAANAGVSLSELIGWYRRLAIRLRALDGA